MASPFAYLANINCQFNLKKESQDFDYFSSQIKKSQESIDYFSSQIKASQSEYNPNYQRVENKLDKLLQVENETQTNFNNRSQSQSINLSQIRNINLSQSQSINSSQSQSINSSQSQSDEEEINIFLDSSKITGNNKKINIYLIHPKNKKNKNMLPMENESQAGYNPFSKLRTAKKIEIPISDDLIL